MIKVARSGTLEPAEYPLLRSSIRNSVKIAIVISSQYAGAAQLASMLLLIRLVETVHSFAVAPIGSHVPRFSRLLSEGNFQQLEKGVVRAMQQAQWVLVLGFSVVAFIAPSALELIQAQATLPDSRVIALFLFTYHLMMVITYSLLLTILGNNYILIKRMLCCCIITLISAPFLIGHFGPYGFILSSFFPFLILLNIKTLTYSAKLMNTDSLSIFRRVFMWPLFTSFCLLSALYIL